MKPLIMSAIASMGTHSMVESTQSISNTDWYLPATHARLYWPHVLPSIEHQAKEILASLYDQEETMQVSNYWFQQYKEGDFHGWHIHGACTFSNVYYVDLPDGASKTTFRIKGKEFEVDVKEGQILAFPSYYPHCSKPNTRGVKTSIAFNTYVGK
jgi:hypothetical protein